jgi:urease subunit alpha
MPRTAVSFVSRQAYDCGIKSKLGLERIVYPVSRCRQITKNDMVLNNVAPQIDINPETFEVLVNGVHATAPAASTFSLSQLYWFS